MASQRLDSPISSYNVGFDEAVYDESPFARSVARHCGTDHHEITVAAGQATPSLLEKVISMYDQPFGDSSCLPTYLVCQAVSQHCKVILSGDGGDEMFGGYSRYGQAESLMSLSRIPLAASALGIAGRVASPLRSDLGRQLRKAGKAASCSRADLALSLITYFSEADIEKLLLPDVWEAWRKNDGFSDFSEYFADKTEPLSKQLIEFEINTLLHADYLRKVDIASMANSLEVRTPFLDRDVFRLAQSIPINYHVGPRRQKRVLKRVAERFVPRETIYRRKQGFGIPFDRWVDNPAMHEFLRDLLTASDAINRGICRPQAVDALLTALLNRSGLRNLSRYQVYQRVFMLISLELWLRRWGPSLN
jgi:asparagine synthase (glutamine-hydrolysing)